MPHPITAVTAMPTNLLIALAIPTATLAHLIAPGPRVALHAQTYIAAYSSQTSNATRASAMATRLTIAIC
jgi:hypothetical protein